MGTRLTTLIKHPQGFLTGQAVSVRGPYLIDCTRREVLILPTLMSSHLYIFLILLQGCNYTDQYTLLPSNLYRLSPVYSPTEKFFLSNLNFNTHNSGTNFSSNSVVIFPTPWYFVQLRGFVCINNI